MTETSSEEAVRRVVRNHYRGMMIAGQADGTRAHLVSDLTKITDGHYQYEVSLRDSGEEEQTYTGDVYRRDDEWVVEEDH